MTPIENLLEAFNGAMSAVRTYHLEIMSRLRVGLNMVEAGESSCPLAVTDIYYTVDGIRGKIFCRHDQRIYELTLKVLSEPLLKNAGAETR